MLHPMRVMALSGGIASGKSTVCRLLREYLPSLVIFDSDAVVHRLLESVREEFDRDEIIRQCGALQQLIYDDQPYLFLFVPEGTSVMWKDAFRVKRPGPDGTWIDEPVTMTKAGWSHYLEWFYRPEYAKEASE